MYPPGFVSSILFILISAIGIIRFDLFKRDFALESLHREKQTLSKKVVEKDKNIKVSKIYYR